MDNTIGSRLKNAWNAFFNKNRTYDSYVGTYYRPDRVRLSRGNERSIVTSVINKIAIDVASIKINHCRLDKEDRFSEIIDSTLNDRLNLEANIDQTSRAFIQDIVMTMFDSGVAVVVPVDTSEDPNNNTSFNIYSMRVGKVVSWYPDSVKINLYNDRIGQKQDIILPKSKVAIIENPLYSVMNEPNSTLQRLIRKLSLLDVIDEQTSSGKLDLIIQLPYVVKSQARKEQADQRRQEIERQLTGSKYGIAYTDGTEKITQLNRPVENQLLKQIEYLTSMLYSQLGVSQEVLNGTADEKVMNNYYTHTIEPLISSITDELDRKFISKTARTQKQKIMFFRDPFKLIPVSQVADIADKFTRNEILTSNEVRQIIGRKPIDDPKADMLVNSNISQSSEAMANIYGENRNQEEPLTPDNGSEPNNGKLWEI